MNIPDDEVSFVDSRVAAGAYRSRSQAVSAAIKLWRTSELEDSYRRVFDEIDPAWGAVAADGLDDDGESW